MNNQLDGLAKGVFRATMGTLLCLAVAAQFAGSTRAADLYVDDAVTSGDGSAGSPYARITDAVARARVLRQNVAIPPGERIVIHVAATPKPPGGLVWRKAL